MADVYNCKLPFPPQRMEGWSDCLLVLIVAWIDDQFYAEAIQELRRTASF